MKNNFYENKKVLVTGGTGLIGKPLVEMLIEQGAKVRIASLDDPQRANPQAEFFQVDLTKYENCEKICKEMDYVFNLVGLKCSPKITMERPATIFDNLILFNTNMLKAAHKAGVKRYLYTSTVGVYSPAEIFYEDDVWKTFPSRNDWCGGWAKRMGELQAEAYAKEHGWENIAIVRPANVYGAYDNFDPENAMVVPSLIRRAMEGENPFVVWGDGSPVRDFIHAKDVARGMMMAIENCPGPQNPINLGSGTGYSIKQLVEIIRDNLDNKPEIVWDTSKPSGDLKRVLDIERAKTLINWEPQISLEEGIKETMEWFSSHKEIIDEKYNVFTSSNKNNFGKKKKVLVCGATGFIGYNTVKALSKREDLEIYGTYLKTEPSKELHEYATMIKADLTKAEDVNKVVQGKDIIIHLAATTSGAKDIISKPYIHVTDNAVMGHLLLRAAFDNNIKHFIFPSCTVMYPPWNNLPLKETDFTGEVEAKYFGAAWMKVGLEKTCEFFSRFGKTKHTVFRHSNIYGPYDKYDLEHSHVFGATITKVMQTPEGGEIVVWGTGEEERDLLYVSDLVDFIETAIDKQQTPFELVNVGLGKSTSVSNLVKNIIQISGKNLKIEYDITKPTIKTKLALDCSKAKEIFKWESKISLEEGIKKTIEWYRENIK